MSRLPAYLLRLEGLAVGVGAIVLYFHGGYSWLLFVLLILAPDLSMLGYLAGTRVGAAAYNAVHNYVPAVALGVVGVVTGGKECIEVSLIWTSHIGVDRLLGFGLKYPTRFNDTHLQRV